MIPMSAGKAVIAQIKYPVIASPKIDGVRAVIHDGVAYSRKLKPLPNRHMQSWARANWTLLQSMDGELIVGPPTAPDVFRRTMSGIMSADGEPDFGFWAFDVFTMPLPYKERWQIVLERTMRMPFAIPCPSIIVTNSDELMEFEKRMVDQGYEGIMIRDPYAIYKYGRSTTRGGELLKIKRFEDAEAVVVDFIEEETNNNPATTNEVGRTKRSSHKANKSGKDTLGALVCKSRATGQTFNIGSGFTADQRADIWAHREQWRGKTVTYRFFPVGVKDAPRHPIFHGLRDD